MDRPLWGFVRRGEGKFLGRRERMRTNQLLGSDRLGPKWNVNTKETAEQKGRHPQVPREIDVEALHDCQMVAEELKRNNVEDSLETINGRGDSDGSIGSPVILVDRPGLAFLQLRIVLAADDDRSTLTSGDLGESGLNLRVERVTSHDDDDGHVFVDQGERTMLEFPGKNTWKPLVSNPLVATKIFIKP